MFGANVQADQFRRRLSAELRRLLARPEVVECIRAGHRKQQLTHTANGGEGIGATEVARHIVRALQSSSSEQG